MWLVEIGLLPYWKSERRTKSEPIMDTKDTIRYFSRSRNQSVKSEDRYIYKIIMQTKRNYVLEEMTT